MRSTVLILPIQLVFPARLLDDEEKVLCNRDQVFALDNADSFHILSQHLLDIVTYAENAKIFL